MSYTDREALMDRKRNSNGWRGFFAAAALVGLMAMPSAAEVKIQKDGENFLVSTSVYQARIDGKTGLLSSLKIGDTVAVEGMDIDLAPRKFEKITVTQQGPTSIQTQIGALDDPKAAQPVMVDKALLLTYDATETNFTMKTQAALKGTIAGRGPRLAIGKEAQMCRSLDYKEAIPMPVLAPRYPWTKVKYYFSSGATLGLLNAGPGNPLNPDENGGVSNFSYSRGGFVSNSPYTYTFICDKGDGKKTIGAPAMTVAEAKTPAVYWQGSPIEATLKITKDNYAKLAGLKGLQVAFEVQDAFEQIVSKGQVPLKLEGDAVEVKVPMGVNKLGWYRAYFTVKDEANSLLDARERLIFSVLKHQENMGESFANQIQTDYTIGLGRIRMHPESPEKIAAQVAEANKNAQGTDVLVTWQIDGSPVGNDPKKFGDYMGKIAAAAGDGLNLIEIINEPNGTLQPREYINTFLRPAYENIKKAVPGVKVVGPVLCGISPDQARYLQDLYKLGLKDVTDELSFHPYAGNFDDGGAVDNMRRIMEVINTNGDSAKQIHFTEAGYFHGGWSSVDSLREIIKHAVSQYVWQNAVMGIDHRHNFYYFTDAMGYYNMWLRSTQLTPAAVALRNYTSLVKGQERARVLSFGSLESVRCFVYPGEQRQIVALWTAANNVPVGAPDPTTAVTFTTDATSVEMLDCFGNPMPAKIEGGKLQLSVGSFPSYLLLPAKAKIEPVAEKWGVNVALASLGAMAESTTEQGTSPAVSAIDGSTASSPAWRSANPNELPQSLTVTLASPASIDRVGLWSYSARGYDVEVMGTDGQWKKVVSKRDQPWLRFRNEPIAPVTTDQIRLTIVDSYGDRAEVGEMQIFSPTGSASATGDLVNWALKSNGATARASSEMKKEVTVAEQDYGAKQPKINKIMLEGKAENVIDGKRTVGAWRDFFPTTWMAAPGEKLPQWVEVQFDAPRKLNSITVYTIAFASWTPQDSGIRDWDVQVWDGKDWKTVDSVTGNTKVSKTSRLKEPVTTEKIRVLVKGTNDAEGAVGIMEIEAYGTK